MASFKTAALAVLTAASLGSAAFVAPAFAEPRKPGVDSSRLDKAPADYSQYRRYYRGGYYRGYNRGAAVAAGVGLGLLGAAAVAANRNYYYSAPAYGYDYGYSEPGYYDAPVYYQPPVRYYAPRYSQRYYGGYYPDNIRDPAGGSYVN